MRIQYLPLIQSNSKKDLDSLVFINSFKMIRTMWNSNAHQCSQDQNRKISVVVLVTFRINRNRKNCTLFKNVHVKLWPHNCNLDLSCFLMSSMTWAKRCYSEKLENLNKLLFLEALRPLSDEYAKLVKLQAHSTKKTNIFSNT